MPFVKLSLCKKFKSILIVFKIIKYFKKFDKISN